MKGPLQRAWLGVVWLAPEQQKLLVTHLCR